MNGHSTSLRSKILVAMATIAGFAIVAMLVANFTLGNVGNTISNLASDNLKTAAASARLAEIGQAIRVDVPMLGSARTRFERESALERLEDHFGHLRQLLATGMGKDEAFSGLGGVLAEVEANVLALDRNVARRFVLAKQREEETARLNRLHGDFLLEVDPLLVDAKFNVESALEARAGEGLADNARRSLVEREVRLTEALGRLHASANLAVGMILRGASETDFRLIEQLQGRLAETVDEGNANAALIASNASAITLRQIWDDIALFATEPDNLLDRRLNESGLLAESAQLQEMNASLLEELGNVVAGAVRESGLRSSLASAEINDVLSGWRVFNAFSTAILLLLLLAFSYFFVRGHLFQRLMKVLEAMGRIASGEKGIQVGVSGSDEIGQLADAVRLFRDKSEALDQRARELRQANVSLTSEIERRRQVETELRETQAELVQAAKLAALGQLSAGIAHEFNQPLTAMGSYTHNALRYLERGDIDKGREKLGDIERLIKRLAKTSNHLKTFARRPQDVLVRNDVTEVVANALTLFKERIERQGVALVMEHPPHPVHVMTEPALLEQVLVNLVSNALDATEPVHPARLTIRISETEMLARIEVEDNGEGIAEGLEGKLFDPFFTTKPPGEGLGLGLSISYNVIRDLGGRLELKRREEGGVIATVELFKT
ncbi:MAG: HAMP domain-containing protein [Nitratireductor sp.]|uniref:ATP-binding protein n=1 Tax=Nitratireductor sp. TaxID=1872084 RepID=UPI0026260BE1|nr:ATP-binding protein [Nitratireductor sp.]MCV0352072.1 HAMP domain-containing protein [Nitratireductor sp.]